EAVEHVAQRDDLDRPKPLHGGELRLDLLAAGSLARPALGLALLRLLRVGVACGDRLHLLLDRLIELLQAALLDAHQGLQAVQRILHALVTAASAASVRSKGHRSLVDWLRKSRIISFFCTASSATGSLPGLYSPICSKVSISSYLAISMRSLPFACMCPGGTICDMTRLKLPSTSIAGYWLRAAILRDRIMWPSRMPSTSSAIGSLPLSSSASTVYSAVIEPRAP